MRPMLSIPILCAALAAQDKASLNRFVPRDSCLVMHMAAPAKWKTDFAKTQFAKLLQAETLSPLVAQASQAIDAGLQELRGSGKFDADLVEKLLSDYAGDIAFSVQVDFADLGDAIKEDRPPSMSVVVAMSPDGKYDLGALASAVQKLVDSETEGRRPLREVTVGDHRLRVTADEGMQACVPLVVDGHLVMLLGTDLEKSAAKLLGSEARYEGGASGQSMFLHAKLEPLVGALMSVIEHQMEGSGAPFDVVQLLRDFGFGSLDTLEMQLGADDKSVASELRLTLGKADSGIFGCMFVDQGTPKLLRYVPPAAEHFGVGAFDVGALYRTIGKLWTGLGDAVPMAFADAEKAFAEEMKVRLKEDLLDHLGTEILSLSDIDAAMQAAAEEDEENPLAMLGGTCICLSLRDGKAFGESLEKALRARGLHASRKSEDYQGTKVHRMRLAGMVEAEYAVTDDLLLLAIGGDEGSRRNLRAVLDARTAAAAGGELPAGLKKHLQGLPEGWNGVSVTPLAAMIEGMKGMLDTMQGMGQLPEEAEMVMQVMGGVAGDLKRLGIDNMVTANYMTARSMLSRMRW